ncbi:hypothetical protein Tco_0822494 [Tanacetum coccineum]|uniref:Uncharacterized protein n=1 Tax=Tanacetum coccineum TaxID=301880 RepID=A0ABQ5AF85_9ASTR
MMDDSDSEEVENIFVEDNEKPMDGLVIDSQKKVEAPPKKNPRKTGTWSGRKTDSPKRNVAFSPETKVRYFDKDDIEEVEHDNAYSKKHFFVKIIYFKKPHGVGSEHGVKGENPVFVKIVYFKKAHGVAIFLKIIYFKKPHGVGHANLLYRSNFIGSPQRDKQSNLYLVYEPLVRLLTVRCG